MVEQNVKRVIWVGKAKEELLKFPEDVIDEVGYILYQIQINQTHTSVKQLKGFDGVFEIISNYKTDTYRTVYALKIDNFVYVLHAFQKKSKQGIKTPKQTIDLIKKRLQKAFVISQELNKGEN